MLDIITGTLDGSHVTVTQGGDLCVDTLGSAITLETTGPFTSCELLHGGRKDKQSNRGLEA